MAPKRKGPPMAPARRPGPVIQEKEPEKEEKLPVEMTHIREGFMEKKSGKFRVAWESRYYVIDRSFDSCYDLTWGKKRGEETHRVRLTGSTVTPLKHDLIEIETSEKILIVKCKNTEERKLWAESLMYFASDKAKNSLFGAVLVAGTLTKVKGGRKRHFVLFSSEIKSGPFRLEYFKAKPQLGKPTVPAGIYFVKQDGKNAQLDATTFEIQLLHGAALHQFTSLPSTTIPSGSNLLSQQGERMVLRANTSADFKRWTKHLKIYKPPRVEPTPKTPKIAENTPKPDNDGGKMVKSTAAAGSMSNLSTSELDSPSPKIKADIKIPAEEKTETPAPIPEASTPLSVQREAPTPKSPQQAMAFAALAAIKRKKKKMAAETPRSDVATTKSIAGASPPPPPVKAQKSPKPPLAPTRENKARVMPVFGAPAQFRLPSRTSPKKKMPPPSPKRKGPPPSPKLRKLASRPGSQAGLPQVSETSNNSNTIAAAIAKVGPLQDALVRKTLKYQHMLEQNAILSKEFRDAQKRLRRLQEANDSLGSAGVVADRANMAFAAMFEEFKAERKYFEDTVLKESSSSANTFRNRFITVTTSMIALAGSRGEKPSKIFYLHDAKCSFSILENGQPVIRLDLKNASLRLFIRGKAVHAQFAGVLYGRIICSRYKNTCQMLLQIPNLSVVRHLDNDIFGPALPLILNGTALSFQLIEIVCSILKGVNIGNGQYVPICRSVSRFECRNAGMSARKICTIIKASIMSVSGKKLEYIDLSNNLLNESQPSIDELSNVLTELKGASPSFPESVDLQNCGIGPSVAKILGTLVAQGKGFGAKLNLAGNHLGSVGATNLVETLSSSQAPITWLNLAENGLKDEGVKNISAVLTKLSKLQTLVIKGNGVTDRAVVSLCAAVEDHKELSGLDITDNPIEFKGGQALAHLAQYKPLNRLCFLNEDLDRTALQMLRLLRGSKQKETTE